MEILMQKGERLDVYFEGHQFRVEYDKNTNENLKLTKII